MNASSSCSSSRTWSSGISTNSPHSTRSIWAPRSAGLAARACACSGCCAITRARRLRSTARPLRIRFQAKFFSYTLKEPIGFVGAIIPWNGPLGACIWKIGPALATGCTVILKPAEEAPLTPLRLGELLMEAGVPPGVVNIVPGYGETAGAALAAHPGVDKVAFTGSHLTGQLIVQASAGNLKRVSLELGGKSPDIVFADADLESAVPGAGMAVFANLGQICSAGTRLFVERKVYDEFVGRVADFGKSLKVGNGVDPDTQIGPLVSEQQLERVTGYLNVARQEGARAVAG